MGEKQLPAPAPATAKTTAADPGKDVAARYSNFKTSVFITYLYVAASAGFSIYALLSKSKDCVLTIVLALVLWGITAWAIWDHVREYYGCSVVPKVAADQPEPAGRALC